MVSDGYVYFKTVDERNGERGLWMTENRMMRLPEEHESLLSYDISDLEVLARDGCDRVYSGDIGYLDLIESLGRDDDLTNYGMYLLLSTRDATITELEESVLLERLVCARAPSYPLGNVCELDEILEAMNTE